MDIKQMRALINMGFTDEQIEAIDKVGTCTEPEAEQTEPEAEQTGPEAEQTEPDRLGVIEQGLADLRKLFQKNNISNKTVDTVKENTVDDALKNLFD